MIAEILNTGKENAITGKSLAMFFQCDLGTITEQIERERREGQPICANMRETNAGYYLAGTPEKLQDYCDRLHHRAAELYKTRQALIAILKKTQILKDPLKSKNSRTLSEWVW